MKPEEAEKIKNLSVAIRNFVKECREKMIIEQDIECENTAMNAKGFVLFISDGEGEYACMLGGADVGGIMSRLENKMMRSILKESTAEAILDKHLETHVDKHLTEIFRRIKRNTENNNTPSV